MLSPDSRPAAARRLSPETATGGLGALPGLGEVTGNEAPGMPGWLPERQPRIERGLANRHLKGGNTLILHDVGSSHLEGRCRPLAAFGHDRDGRKGRRQIVHGPPCAADGRPVAAEVFPGNASDPSTAASRAGKARRRFGVDRVALAGDRGTTATARIREDLAPAGPDRIPALKTGDVRRLLKAGPEGGPAPRVPEAPVADAVAEVTGPDLPGERLTVCTDPRLREERRRRREDLLKAAEEALAGIAAAAAPRRPGPANRDAHPRRAARPQPAHPARRPRGNGAGPAVPAGPRRERTGRRHEARTGPGTGLRAARREAGPERSHEDDRSPGGLEDGKTLKTRSMAAENCLRSP